MVDLMDVKERPKRKSSIYDGPIIGPGARISSKRAEDFGMAIAAHKDPKPARGQESDLL